MTPLEHALAYLDAFFAGDVDALVPLLAPDCTFEGPLLRTDTAAAYLDALRADPPVGMTYELVQAVEGGAHVAVVYRFRKAGIDTPMAQFFRVHDGRITSILLVYDATGFS